MATKIQLQSSGAISIDNIKDVLYGTASSITQSLANFSLVTSKSHPDAISEFYSYYVECDCTTTPPSFPYSAGTSSSLNQLLSITIVGVDALFTTTSNNSWISVADNNTTNEVNVWMNELNDGPTRDGSITIKHDNNPDCYDTVTITQNGQI